MERKRERSLLVKSGAQAGIAVAASSTKQVIQKQMRNNMDFERRSMESPKFRIVRNGQRHTRSPTPARSIAGPDEPMGRVTGTQSRASDRVTNGLDDLRWFGNDPPQPR